MLFLVVYSVRKSTAVYPSRVEVEASSVELMYKRKPVNLLALTVFSVAC